MADPSTHLFWITSRAAGTVAMALASLSVGLGLAMSGRLLRGRLADRRAVHEALSLAVLGAVAIHALALVGDSFMRPSVLDVTVPFVSSYRTGLTSLGIVSGWGLLILGLSFYVRGRIGVRRWRVLHRFTLVAWGGGLIHSVGEGTDAGQTWFLLLLALTVMPALLALCGRLVDEHLPQAPDRGVEPRLGA
jgi:sulfoxide reductase heme-binding subunit YedZ